jgi:predicted secreted acid phosphatase
MRRALQCGLGALVRGAVIAAAVGWVAGACAADCPAVRPTHIPAAAQPLNLDKIKDSLRTYHAQLYEEDIAAVVADAKDYLGSRAGQVTKPALVLDIDETSLSNWPNIAADDLGFILGGPCDALPKGPCGFTAWEFSSKASAIAPTLELFRAAKAKAVAVFFITGRHERERAITVRNLRQVGFTGWTQLVLRANDDTKRTVLEFKSEERAKIAARGYTIIVNVGDQQSDVDGGNSECVFKLPNPFYFIP